MLEGLIEVELGATRVSDCWAVRPKDALGTCGFHPVAWTVQYIKAASPAIAIARAKKIYMVKKA